MNYEQYKSGMDDTLNPGSPHFKGSDCENCGNNTYQSDEEGYCEKCHRVKCAFCGELKYSKDTKTTEGKRVICSDCQNDPKSIFKFIPLSTGLLRMAIKKPVTEVSISRPFMSTNAGQRYAR